MKREVYELNHNYHIFFPPLLKIKIGKSATSLLTGLNQHYHLHIKSESAEEGIDIILNKLDLVLFIQQNLGCDIC